MVAIKYPSAVLSFVQKNVQFEFFSGFSETQKQKSILSLHNSFLSKHGNMKILEISSKSQNPLGISLSAFNLMIENKIVIGGKVDTETLKNANIPKGIGAKVVKGPKMKNGILQIK